MNNLSESALDLIAGLDHNNRDGTGFPYGWQLLRCQSCHGLVSPNAVGEQGQHVGANGCGGVVLPNAIELRALGKRLRNRGG